MAIKGPVYFRKFQFAWAIVTYTQWEKPEKAKRDSDPNSSGSSNDAITSTEAGFRSLPKCYTCKGSEVFKYSEIFSPL